MTPGAPFRLPEVDDVVARALAEDFGVDHTCFTRPGSCANLIDRDVTTSSIFDSRARFRGAIVARQAGVACGLPVVEAVYGALALAVESPEDVEVFPLVAEGAFVEAGSRLVDVEGPARLVLAGERTALNFVMVLSGIATEARRWQEAVGSLVRVCDTRKTVPGLRSLSKYAVRVGGATNHRIGLFDMALVKDNHRAAAGGARAAVDAVRAAHGQLAVEVEADDVSEAAEAVQAGADLVLLDNMDANTLTRAVKACRAAARERGREVQLEASGSVTLDRLAEIAATGVDRISSSSLTLARPLDIGLDEG